MKQIHVLLIMVISLSLFSLTCKDNGLQILDKFFTLTVEDASCTEVWLKIRIAPGSSHRSVMLKRDTVVSFTRTLNELETVVIDTNLLPNHTYTYTAQLLNGSTAVNSTARTMDTTSHDFTWQTFTLGDGTGSSTLNDVAIINDTCIWAVGEIWQGGTTYNAAKWNGQIWELKRIQSIICGSNTTIVSPLRTIFAFNENDIWFSDGGEMIHWNGQNYYNDCSMNSLLTGAITKIWGASSNSLYVVGNNGAIIHYNGSPNVAGSWTKIESGTSLNFYDLYGEIDKATGQQQILAVAANRFVSFEKMIIQIHTNNTIGTVSINGIPYDIHGIWSKNHRICYIVGSGMYRKLDIASQATWKAIGVSNYYIEAIRGIEYNDIAACGDLGELLHYNGSTWVSYQNIFSGILFYSIAMKANMIVAVGTDGSRSYTVIGRR